jgi:Flp pilus assembly pilin Flp
MVSKGVLANQLPLGAHSKKCDHPGGKVMRQQTAVAYSLASGSRGQTMAEYAMILATIAVVAAAFVQNAGTIVSELVSHVSALF